MHDAAQTGVLQLGPVQRLEFVHVQTLGAVQTPFWHAVHTGVSQVSPLKPVGQSQAPGTVHVPLQPVRQMGCVQSEELE